MASGEAYFCLAKLVHTSTIFWGSEWDVMETIWTLLYK